MGTAFIYLYSVIVDTLAFFTMADIVSPFSGTALLYLDIRGTERRGNC